MIEALIVLGLVVGLAVLGLLAPVVPPEWAIAGGAICSAFGMLLGVPTGLWYHVKLRACLASRDELPARWWLRPTALHGRLRDSERPEVMRWFALGGLGFGFTVLGCALAVAGLALHAFRGV